jgi:hypothetical protein
MTDDEGWHVPKVLTKVIATELGCHPQTMREWLHRFNTNGLKGPG